MNNRIVLRISFAIVVSLFMSCDCEDCGGGNGSYPIEATINFINETSDSIKSIDGCNRDINPESTITIKVKDVLGSKPNINNFPVSIFSNCSMMYKHGINLKCEKQIENILNYENRKEVSPLVFEFTFRFTEEKKAKAENCN